MNITKAAGRILRKSAFMSLLLILLLASPIGAESPTHVVQPGENLSKIAAQYKTTVQAIIGANNLTNPNVITAGQKLRIPGGEITYTVAEGDLLSVIAARYEITPTALALANKLDSPYALWPGQKLTIPGNPAEITAAAAIVVPTATPSASTSTATTSSAPASGGKWIEVVLSNQTTLAWEGSTLVRRMIVSTGLPGTPTVVGRFQIYVKYVSAPMSGPGYYLPAVPHVMYFYRGYSLHGAYWHNNFGHPMSHGCVNLSLPDAAWLFNWAPVGTTVVVHW
jgi:lipoprotein-anchoring transpeptidase ErfK/SrfK